MCKRFAEWCEKCCDGIFGINNSVVGDTADSLSNKPMIYAVGLAFVFSVLWLAIAPVILLVYMIVFPLGAFVPMAEEDGIMPALNFTLKLLLLFVMFRFVSCKEVFEGALRIGIYAPRRMSAL